MNEYTETLGSRDQDKTDTSTITFFQNEWIYWTLGSRDQDKTDISMITFFQNEWIYWNIRQQRPR